MKIQEKKRRIYKNQNNKRKYKQILTCRKGLFEYFFCLHPPFKIRIHELVKNQAIFPGGLKIVFVKRLFGAFFYIDIQEPLRK